VWRVLYIENGAL